MKFRDLLDMSLKYNKQTIGEAFEFFDFYIAPRFNYEQMIKEQAEFMNEYNKLSLSLENYIEDVLHYLYNIETRKEKNKKEILL
jgi:hypothetical protein